MSAFWSTCWWLGSVGGQGESQDEDRKHLLWLCYNKASAFVVCRRSVDCRSIAIAQSSRHNDMDGSDGQAASQWPREPQSSSVTMMRMVRQPVAQRAKSTMLAIHPRMTIYTGSWKLTKRLSDRDKKEIARFASSRLTLDLPRYLWSLI